MKIKSIQRLSLSLLVAGLLVGAGSTKASDQTSKKSLALSNFIYLNNFEGFEKMLFENPTLLNEKNVMGKTPLQTAIYAKKPEILNYLIKNGADLNVKDDEGRALPKLAEKVLADVKIELERNKNEMEKLQEIIKILTEKKPVLTKIESSQPPENKILRFQYFVINSPKARIFKAMDELLIAYPMLINATNDMGKTPLEVAILHRKLDAVKYLIEKGADLNIKSSGGLTLLEFAKSNLKDLQLKTFKLGNEDKEIALKTLRDIIEILKKQ